MNNKGLEIYDPMYDYTSQVLSAWVGAGDSGKIWEWEIDIEDLADMLGYEVLVVTTRVDYPDDRGEDYDISVLIGGVPIEYFFFTYNDLEDAAIEMYSTNN